MALLGTAAALLTLGIANNIYVQIGLVLLIALSAKNAILIVEMAREGREKGLSIPEATVDASRVRFRPILMTSFTFILGVLPARPRQRRRCGGAALPRHRRRDGDARVDVPGGAVRPGALRRPAAMDRAEGTRPHRYTLSPEGRGRGEGFGGLAPVLAKFFIERPVLANVIAFVTILLGAVALFVLPVSQYPPITPPTVQVTANYPGANAKTMVETVALPIEQQVNGVEGMLYMQSTSTNDGRYTLIVTFRVGTDLDLAQVLVQNRVAAALAQLPQAVQQQGVVTKKKSTAILQIVTLTSEGNRYDALYLSNFATLQLHDKLARVPGVGDVTVFGIGQYSMRIWLDPEQMLQRSLMPSDVIAAVQAQNAYVAAGQIGVPPTRPGEAFQLTIDLGGNLSRAEEFERRHRQELGRADHAGPRRRPRRARRADLRPVLQGERPRRRAASRSTSCPRPTPSTRPRACGRRWPRSPGTFRRASSTRFRSTRRRS